MRFLSEHSRLRGFSLLEVILALFIFSLVMMSVTSYFASTTVANRNTRLLQQNLEDVGFAMNRIAKVLRTSVVLSPILPSPVTSIRVYDYSQGACLRYEFSGNTIHEFVSTAPFPGGGANEKTWCASVNVGDFTSVSLITTTGASISGRFYVIPSNDGVPAGDPLVAGRVTMNAKITRVNNFSTIQTTVSLRNYKEVYPLP
jgi:prepilin-type N-terminal cleavage/methylation domain-containing protein